VMTSKTPASTARQSLALPGVIGGTVRLLGLINRIAVA
jgi:hypothetical protein